MSSYSSEFGNWIDIGPLTMRVPMNVIYEPKPDITAYELAQLLPYFINGQGLYREDFDRLGAIQRHLREVK